MNLTQKQKEFIKKKTKSNESFNFAKQFNLEQKLIDEYIQEIKTKKEPKWFYLILILIPIVFFSLLELGLRTIDYGKDYSVFVPLSDSYKNLLVFNPNYPYKFFENTSTVPSVIPDPFDKKKVENTFRVFVLGGSTTAGFPFSYNASFARYVKRRLEILYPKIKIEVINMGISAVNSYTINDIIPMVIDQAPDLVLVYAGHNEYYGALGIGSTESIGNSRWLVKLSLFLRSLKTYQFIGNIIKSVKESDASSRDGNHKTLMSQLVGEDLIEYKSDLFYKGISQFKNNIEEVLKELSKSKINTIVGTLTSNLKQQPFESIGKDKNSANFHFQKAESYFLKQNYKKAKSEYILAKEMDALKFRAPEEINETIELLSSKYQIPMVDVDSLFSAKSVGNITGHELMVDHLHPTVEGHQIIGNLFFDAMIKNSYLPNGEKQNLSLLKQRSLASQTLSYTRFDSIYSEVILNHLLNRYPFIGKGEIGTIKYSLENFSDSIAEKTAKGTLTWEQGHYMVAEKYFHEQNYSGFIDELMALIDDRPFIKSNYKYCVEKLKSVNKLSLALRVLLIMNNKFHDNFSAKWLGTIAMNRKLYQRAIHYFEKVLENNKSDAQVYFNISGAYYYTKQLSKAESALKNCLAINPNYPGAKVALRNF